MMSRTGNNRAVTLIEVMMTVIILTVGILGIIQAYIKSFDVLRISKDMLIEVSLAESKMAELQRSELENGGLDQTKTKGVFSGSYAYYKWELDITPSDIQGLNSVKLRCFTGEFQRLNEFVLASYVKNK